MVFVNVHIHFRILTRIRNPRTDPDPAKAPDPCGSGYGSGSTTLKGSHGFVFGLVSVKPELSALKVSDLAELIVLLLYTWIRILVRLDYDVVSKIGYKPFPPLFLPPPNKVLRILTTRDAPDFRLEVSLGLPDERQSFFLFLKIKKSCSIKSKCRYSML
jgi:hypothetical protein